MPLKYVGGAWLHENKKGQTYLKATINLPSREVVRPDGVKIQVPPEKLYLHFYPNEKKEKASQADYTAHRHSVDKRRKKEEGGS